jgi:hypothetical protein
MSCNTPSNLEVATEPRVVKKRRVLSIFLVLLLLAGLFFLVSVIALTASASVLSPVGRGGVASAHIPAVSTTATGILPDLNPVDWIWNGITGFWNKLWWLLF